MSKRCCPLRRSLIKTLRHMHSSPQPGPCRKNLHPRLLIRPKDITSLSNVIAYLAETDLDFAVRSQGYGNASAKDVLISLTAFDEFSFDREKEFVTVGAGQSWDDYYRKMEAEAPDYTSLCSHFCPVGYSLTWTSCRLSYADDRYRRLDALWWILVAIWRIRLCL